MSLRSELDAQRLVHRLIGVAVDFVLGHTTGGAGVRHAPRIRRTDASKRDTAPAGPRVDVALEAPLRVVEELVERAPRIGQAPQQPSRPVAEQGLTDGILDLGQEAVLAAAMKLVMTPSGDCTVTTLSVCSN